MSIIPSDAVFYRHTVKKAVDDPGVQSDIWTDYIWDDVWYVIRLSFGAIIKERNAKEAIRKAQDLWRAHQRLTGEHDEGVRMGSTQ